MKVIVHSGDREIIGSGTIVDRAVVDKFTIKLEDLEIIFQFVSDNSEPVAKVRFNLKGGKNGVIELVNWYGVGTAQYLDNIATVNNRSVGINLHATSVGDYPDGIKVLNYTILANAI